MRVQLFFSLVLGLGLVGCLDSGSNTNNQNTNNQNNNNAPACSPDNCQGCCNGDVCEAGDSSATCGTGGNQCQACPTGASCTGGVCVLPCGPDNCQGCCDAGGNCVDGTADTACGTAGASCAPCSATETCSSGQCVAADCQSTCNGCCSGTTCLEGNSSSACGTGGDVCEDCGTGRACDAGSCVVDPTSRWDIVLVSADVPLYDIHQETWDPFGGLPDPYVVFTVGGVLEAVQTDQSTVKDDATSGVWNDVVLGDVSARTIQDQFCAQVFDDDGLNEPDAMCAETCEPVEDWFFSDTLLEWPLTPSVIVRFKIRPH